MEEMFGILLLNLRGEVGIFMIEVESLFPGLCGCMKRLNISVGRGEAIKTLWQIAF